MNENVSGIMDIDKQDKKKADVSSDLGSSCLEGDRSYLNLDTKEVISMASSTPQNSKNETVTNKQ